MFVNVKKRNNILTCRHIYDIYRNFPDAHTGADHDRKCRNNLCCAFLDSLFANPVNCVLRSNISTI